MSARRGSHWRRRRGKRATADDPLITAPRQPGRPIRGCTVEVVVPAIICHLKDISQHVVKTKLIWPKAANRCSSFTIPSTSTPLARGIVLADVVAPPTRSGGPRARGILPLGLAQQPIWPFAAVIDPDENLLVQPLHIGLRIRPIHADNRILIGLLKHRIEPICIGSYPIQAGNVASRGHLIVGLLKKFPKLACGDRIFSNRKFIADAHPVLRRLCLNPRTGEKPGKQQTCRRDIALDVCVGGPHQKFPRRKHHHLRAVGTFAKTRANRQF